MPFVDHAAQAQRLRERAEECRVLADIMEDDQARSGYLVLAEAYAALAAREEGMIGVVTQDRPTD